LCTPFFQETLFDGKSQAARFLIELCARYLYEHLLGQNCDLPLGNVLALSAVEPRYQAGTTRAHAHDHACAISALEMEHLNGQGKFVKGWIICRRRQTAAVACAMTLSATAFTSGVSPAINVTIRAVSYRKFCSSPQRGILVG
jgi:hypothetical protein